MWKYIGMGMVRLHKTTRHFTPFQSLLTGYIIIIFAGSLLLSLPFASASHVSQPYLDAFFTATSAATTTGLIVVGTGSHYSFFGQMVILILLQVGGLGYMIVIAMITYGFGRKLSLDNASSLHESMVGVPMGNLKMLVKRIVVITLLIEAAGTAILAFRWMGEYPMAHAFYMGFFHSVSAFCTAGFGLLDSSLQAHQNDFLINSAISSLCILGGLGFHVLLDLLRFFSRGTSTQSIRLSLHSRLVLTLSVVIFVSGTAVIYVSGRSDISSPSLMSAAFQAVSASTTTGFNTVDIGAMHATSLFAIVILMFVGASPGGSGGGIKNTTLAVMLLSVAQTVRRSKEVHVCKRRISQNVISKSFAIGLTALMLITLDTLIMTLTENATFLQILFEVVSAFGTVGLSTGLTPTLSVTGKILISISMLVGRLGPLAIGFALVGRPRVEHVSYAEGEVLVG